MLRENCGRRGAAGSDFAGARVSAGSSAVVASRGGRPRAAGRRRGRATAWVWWYPREKVSQASVAARSTSISWPTFLRSQSPGFCKVPKATPSHPRIVFKGSHRAQFRFWPAGRGRSAAAGAAVRRRRGPTAAGRRIRGLRRCRGRRVVRCSALRSWLEELRSLPRSSVVARRRARGRARAVYNGAGAAGGGRRGEPPPRRRRLRGQRRPRWAAPLAAFVGTRWLETSRSGTCASQIALRRTARAPRRPGVRNCGGGGGGDLPARPSRREGRRLRARRAVWRRRVCAPPEGLPAPRRAISALATARRRP